METFNILMLGGKRCGKTTVLGSMYNQIEKAVACTDLSISYSDDATKAELTKAKDAIKAKMDMFQNKLIRVEVDENATDAKSEYKFTLSVKHYKIPFVIHDVPGEWLENENQEKIRKLIDLCDVIMIAIDTPYLFSKMTSKGYGIYHEEYNKPVAIANFFKNSLRPEQIKHRMVLFVPIKCERYYHLTYSQKLNLSKRDLMQELVSAISYGYADLISYLRSTKELANNCTIAITPILSAGGIDFVHFREDPLTGKMVSLYQQPEFLPADACGYSPSFCEQPLIYSLIYILRRAIDAKKNKSIFAGIGGGDLKQMETAYNTLCGRIKRGSGSFSEDGYY